jgi:nucleotide-binding universal stress UspA family protein
LGGVGVQNLEDIPVHDAVVLETCILLEVADGPGGAGVEEAVHGAWIEAQVVEHPLELDHVGPPERWLAEVEKASPWPVAGLHDLAPGDRPDEPVR